MSESLYLALGYKCNHHCFFCPCGKERGSASADTDSIVQQLEYAVTWKNIGHVTLSGGEPTLHPDFPRILQRCIELGTQVTVLTNADRLHDLQFARRCFENTDLTKVSVVSAIHSADPALHDKVTGIHGSHGRTIAGLKNLIELKIPITVKQCVSSWNFHALPKFPEFVFREFGPNASMTICGMDFCGMNEGEIREIAVGYREMGPELEKMLDQVLIFRKRFHAFPLMTVCDLPLCAVDPFYWQFYAIVSRRKLAQYSAPTVNSNSVESHFDIVNDCDVYFNSCLQCDAADWCPGVWRTAYTYFGESEVHPLKGRLVQE